MTPSIEERREVALRLRRNAEANPGMSLVLNLSFANRWLRPGGAMEWEVSSHDAALRLADLIDPECWERTVEDYLAMIERNRELESELARLKGRPE